MFFMAPFINNYRMNYKINTPSSEFPTNTACFSIVSILTSKGNCRGISDITVELLYFRTNPVSLDTK